MGTVASFHEVKLPGLEAHHSPPNSGEGNKSTPPYSFMVWCLITRCNVQELYFFKSFAIIVLEMRYKTSKYLHSLKPGDLKSEHTTGLNVRSWCSEGNVPFT
jgi:hypothetical protein